ncbi:acyl--CoA ligase [Pseudomaricurvus alcaniphilus]|uniref:class I adenylate-forming enzyme family protein n=1 Tax=Pseudomaricurvus alcaniphilus TaxID=1166482 RepID=UPI00140D8123|nr:class I adenylate-forming enzyme family protein [Pseudomaricurvus alcaniphilus]NHN38470.1 acyl--CoA ligase [Pseudomaricurvus alcaniphilus]
MTVFASPAPLLPEILALHGKWKGDKPALVCAGQWLSWRDFSDSLNRVANALDRHGVGQRDHVVVLMNNGIEMVQAMFGIMAAGAVSVPINLSVSDAAIAGMIEDSGASAIVVTPPQEARIEALRASLPEKVKLLVTTGTGNQDFIGWRDFLGSSSAATPAVTIEPDDLLNIIYSSGTTGLPKGIAHTHRGRRDWAYDLGIALRYHSAARTLLTIGLYSNISWVAMLTTLLAGGTLFVHESFDADHFIASVERDRITHTAMVPIQYQRLAERLRQRPDADVSSMQAMMCCGSPLHESLKQEIYQRFNGGIIELYGLTEGIITTLDPEEAEGRWASVGKPLLGTDIVILGADDRPLPAGQAGEIAARGRISMPGYYNRPEANEEACWRDELGRAWLRSGDIGRLDEQGYLYIVDRKKDMILSGGQNIYPQDIEAVLIEHSAVNDVAVIAAGSQRWGETPIALVVLEAGVEEKPDLIKAWCNQRVGKQQRLADVIVVDALPRNPNGKVLKRELRKQYAERQYS